MAFDPTRSCRVGIVDDHELLLDGLTTYVRTYAQELNVTIRATEWFDLVRDPAFPPDVVIMGLELQGAMSIETRVRLCRAAGSSVVVVSALDTHELRERAMAAGAFAFVPKSRPADEVVRAVRAAWHSDAGSLAEVSPSRDVDAVATERDERGASGFSAAEIDVLRLYAGGYSPVDIGLRLTLPFETVKAYLNRFRKHYADAGRSSLSKKDLIRRVAEDGLLL